MSLGEERARAIEREEAEAEESFVLLRSPKEEEIKIEIKERIKCECR